MYYVLAISVYEDVWNGPGIELATSRASRDGKITPRIGAFSVWEVFTESHVTSDRYDHSHPVNYAFSAKVIQRFRPFVTSSESVNIT